MLKGSMLRQLNKKVQLFVLKADKNILMQVNYTLSYKKDFLLCTQCNLSDLTLKYELL